MLDNLSQDMMQWVWIGSICGLVIVLIMILTWWGIFAKAGHSGARSLLLLIPVVNVIIFLFFAFGDWPIHDELDALHEQNAMLRQQLAVMQQNQQLSSNPGYSAFTQSHPSTPGIFQQYPSSQQQYH